MDIPSMRRSNQQLESHQALALLTGCTYGVLSLQAPGGYPYGVPLNHVYHQGKLYFHCGKKGHKINLIGQQAKACFTVVAQSQVVPHDFSTKYQSVMAFGRVAPMDDEKEKRTAIALLANHFTPGDDYATLRQREIDASWPGLVMLVMTIDHLTGKRSKQL